MAGIKSEWVAGLNRNPHGRGYGTTAAGKANLAIATNQIAERYAAVAMTLEMPFKDCESHPDPVFGWSPNRSRALGAACLEVLAEIIDMVDFTVAPATTGVGSGV